MVTHPELRVLAGPAEGDSLVLSESDRSYVLGSANADLIVRDIPVRLVFQRAAGRVTLTASDGADATVNGQVARLPRELEPGDVIRLPGLSPTLIEYRDAGSSPGASTAELPSALSAIDTNEMAASASSSDEERVLDDDEATSMVSRETVNRILGLASGDPDIGSKIRAAVHEDATLHLDDADAFAEAAARALEGRQAPAAAPPAPAPGPPPPAPEPELTAPSETDPGDRTILASDWDAARASAMAPPAAPAAGPPPEEPSAEDRTILASDWRDLVPASAPPPQAAPPAPAPAPPPPPPPATETEGTLLAQNPLPRILASAPPPPPPVPSPDQTLLGSTGAMPAVPMTSFDPPPSPVPSRPAPPAAGGRSMLVKALLGFTILALLVIIGGAAVIILGSKPDATPGQATPAPTTVAPTPVATAPPTAATSTTPAIVENAAPPAGTIPRILRVEPPSSPPGSTIKIEVADTPQDVRVFFEATLGRTVSRTGDEIVVEVPDPGTSTSVGIVLRSGDVASLPFMFTIDQAPPTTLAFRYELKSGAFNGGDVATIYMGPVPLGIVVAKGGATSIEEKAKLVTLEMESAKVALSTNAKAFLRIQKGRNGWDIQVALPDAPPLATPHSVSKDEVAFVAAQGSVVAPERLAGYWMGILHDVLALTLKRNEPFHLPDDAPGARVLRKLMEGGIEKGYATLAPDERQVLEALALRVPDTFGNFTGTFRGTSAVDRNVFQDITWPRAELTMDLAIQPFPAMDGTGQISVGWVTAVDDSGVNKTHQKVGDFTIQGAHLDPTNLNRMTFSIDRNGKSISFDVTRKVDPVTKAPMLEGRYGGTTDFVLRRL